MKDVFDILAEFVKRYPNLQWPIVLAICALIVLIWKTIEVLGPKAIIFLVNKARQLFSSRKINSEQEVLIRNFTERSQVLSWLSCIKSLSKYHLIAAIEDIYFPLRYKLVNGRPQFSSSRIERILYDNQVFAIVGPPGSGKSTVLSKIAIAYAKDKVEEIFEMKESRLPLFLNLKTLPFHLDSLPKVLTDTLRHAGCDLQDTFLLDQLKRSRCIVLLDGLDETGDDLRRRQVVDWITASMATFPGNRFVVTCRNAEWDLVSVPNIPYANVLDLTSDEIDGIINQWEQCLAVKQGDLPADGHSEADSLSKVLSKTENRNLMLLAKNPLLLTIMIILKFHGVNIPIRKVDVYNVFVRTLLGEWEEIKNLSRDVTGIRLKKRLKLFQRLSLFLLENPSLGERIVIQDKGLSSFMQQQFINIFQEDISVSEFLDTVAIRTGLLCKSGDDLYLFSNRGFLEFLAAKELADNLAYDIVCQHISHENWRETIIQFMSLLTDATTMIGQILEDDGRPNDLPYSLLASALLEAVSVDSILRDKAITLINAHIIEGLTTGKVDFELIKDVYTLNPDFWLKFMKEALIKNNHVAIEASVVCEILSSLDDTTALDCLRDIADIAGSIIRREIVQSLRLSMSTKAIDILWTFTDKDVSREIVIDSLAAKGDLVIASCKEVLSNSSSTQNMKEIAISVLCRINNPLVIRVLSHLMKSTSPSLHEHIVSEMHQVYFSGYTLKEAEKVADLMQDVFAPSIYTRSAKRYLDILFAAVLLFVMCGVFPFISLLIKLDSPGPIFYKQRRVGMKGKEFFLYKWRTMRLDAERDGPVWASQADPRVTGVGRFLRKTHLDELLQVINVLRGDMSFIGPRPERPYFSAHFQESIPHYLLRYSVRPGLTGLSQVSYVYGASSEDVRKKLVYDLYYISNCSFFLDLSIIAKTVGLALRGSGAR